MLIKLSRLRDTVSFRPKSSFISKLTIFITEANVPMPNIVVVQVVSKPFLHFSFQPSAGSPQVVLCLASHPESAHGSFVVFDMINVSNWISPIADLYAMCTVMFRIEVITPVVIKDTQ